MIQEILYAFSTIETAVATFAALLPFGYAFGAGMVAAVNPCGFLMLPAFGSYYLGSEGPAQRSAGFLSRLVRAIAMGLVATTGFVTLFGVIGLLLSLGGRWVIQLFPWGGLLVGIALTGLGAWLLVTGHSVGVLAASRVQVRPSDSVRQVFLFGVGYGVCSLACTLPIFLVVVGTALATGGLMRGLTQFVSYGLGMGMALVLVTISVALFRDGLTGRLRRFFPYAHRVAAVFLLAAGLYIIYYWVVLGDLLA